MSMVARERETGKMRLPFFTLRNLCGPEHFIHVCMRITYYDDLGRKRKKTEKRARRHNERSDGPRFLLPKADGVTD